MRSIWCWYAVHAFFRGGIVCNEDEIVVRILYYEYRIPHD